MLRNATSAQYLYAIVAGSGNRTYGPVGINGALVHTIGEGAVAAVVSLVPSRRIRPERRNLAAYQAVLRHLMQETTPLPVAFGTIAESAGVIRRCLSRNQDILLQQLQRVAGKVEMELRVTWDVPNIFEYFVATHAELRAARDRLYSTHQQPAREDKIELGRLFDRSLNHEREACTDKVEEVLSPRCEEIRRNPARNEREVMRLACLVERDGQTQFEEGVAEAAKLFDKHFAFDFNGPWAPHHFVNVAIEV